MTKAAQPATVTIAAQPATVTKAAQPATVTIARSSTATSNSGSEIGGLARESPRKIEIAVGAVSDDASSAASANEDDAAAMAEAAAEEMAAADWAAQLDSAAAETSVGGSGNQPSSGQFGQREGNTAATITGEVL